MATNDPFDYDLDALDNDIGLDPEDRAQVRTNKLDWYKAEKGRIDRAAFVFFNTVDFTAMRVARRKTPGLSRTDLQEVARTALQGRAAALSPPKQMSELNSIDRLDLNEVRFKKLLAHYQEGLGYVISRLGLDGPDYDMVWRSLPEPKQYFTTLLLIYPTTRDGKIIKDCLSTDWKVMPWRFSPDRYNQICKRNQSLVENGISIASQDITIECKDTQFQNVQIDGAGPAIYRKAVKFQEAVLTKALEMYEKLNPFREMTSTDLKIKLNMAGGGAVTTVGTEDYGDILDKV